jgi:hypothetical protein
MSAQHEVNIICLIIWAAGRKRAWEKAYNSIPCMIKAQMYAIVYVLYISIEDKYWDRDIEEKI